MEYREHRERLLFATRPEDFAAASAATRQTLGDECAGALGLYR